MKLISRKKSKFAISREFDRYLREFNRSIRLSVHYDDLLKFDEAMPLYDKQGDDTLWVSVVYGQDRRDEIASQLLEVYAFLRAEGDRSFMRHLHVDRVDLCLYGNTRPFRVRIINRLNDNFDYFYVKEADASRAYGLELEHILSPNRIGFFCFENTLIEEHISGIPADMYLLRHLGDPHQNEVRFAKEFVKFNERCFLRLLGDMHSGNFVVNVIVDFEENSYRLRAIDFDQQSYEPRKRVYMPQFFKQNLPFVKMVTERLPEATIVQYQREERALIHQRMRSAHYRLEALLAIMEHDTLAPEVNVRQLAEELAEHHGDASFRSAKTMGALVRTSLESIKKAKRP